MSGMIAIKKVVLNERHLRPGRTLHTIHDKRGKREYPPFISLLVTQSPENSELIMWRFCGNGQAAHTHHDTLDDALHQAEVEFEVSPSEWLETSEPFPDLKNG